MRAIAQPGKPESLWYPPCSVLVSSSVAKVSPLQTGTALRQATPGWQINSCGFHDDTVQGYEPPVHFTLTVFVEDRMDIHHSPEPACIAQVVAGFGAGVVVVGGVVVAGFGAGVVVVGGVIAGAGFGAGGVVAGGVVVGGGVVVVGGDGVVAQVTALKHFLPPVQSLSSPVGQADPHVATASSQVKPHLLLPEVGAAGVEGP